MKEKNLDDVAIAKRLTSVADTIGKDAGRLGQAAVEPAPGEAGVFHVSLPGVDATRLAAMLTEPLEAENVLQRGGVTAEAGAQQLTLRVLADVTQDQLTQKIHNLSGALLQSAENLSRANVNSVLEVGGVAQGGLIWNVTSTATNMRLVEYALDHRPGR